MALSQLSFSAPVGAERAVIAAMLAQLAEQMNGFEASPPVGKEVESLL